ncbi:hypothetical protein ADUPG1_000745, partial [Aduncisulcus paluster]
NHYGNKTTLDTFYSLDTIKLREVSEDKVAAYVTKYKATLRRLAEDETLGDKALTEQFLKGIKHPRFRLRMKAALEGGYKDMSGLTRLIFQQVQLVLETLEDAKGYLEEPRGTGRSDKGFGTQRPTGKNLRKDHRTRRVPRDKQEIVCWKCGKKGHFASECTASTNTTSKDRKEVTCFNCKKVGHYASECPRKTGDKPSAPGSRSSFRPVISTSKPGSPYLLISLFSTDKAKAVEKTAILDTGAVFNIISQSLLAELEGLDIVNKLPCTLELVLGDGRIIQAEGKVSLTLRTRHPDTGGFFEFQDDFIVIAMEKSADHQIFIGYQTICQKDLFNFMKLPLDQGSEMIPDINLESWLWESKERIPEEESMILHGFSVGTELCAGIEKILEDFDHQMDGSESIPPLVIRLKPDAEFTAKSARRIPRARRAFVEKEVKDLLE